MSWRNSSARTNLTSKDVQIKSNMLGEGCFRRTYAGTFLGGNRNQQEAACKKFKREYHHLEDEYFANDFLIAAKCIELADEWNKICEAKKEIMISNGEVHNINGTKYLVEPLIRFYRKYTSNSGWIDDAGDDALLVMEAFSHYTYHESDEELLVCDLQGRYRHDKYRQDRCRFELTDPAICSIDRDYGPTDLGEKGIHSFFANHECNCYCKDDWSRPYAPRQWMDPMQGTSMFASSTSSLLRIGDTTMFRGGVDSVLIEPPSQRTQVYQHQHLPTYYEEEEESDSDPEY